MGSGFAGVFRPDAGRREQGRRGGRVRKQVCGSRRIVCLGLRSSPSPGEAPKANAAIAAQAHAFFCALCASLRLKMPLLNAPHPAAVIT
jgi:hypothetical protein